MKILVAGSAGFIGHKLCERLCGDGHAVIGIDCYTDDYSVPYKKSITKRLLSEYKNFKFEKIDILDFTSLKSFFDKDNDIEVVINMTSPATLRASFDDPYPYHNINATGTLNLLECAKDLHKLKKFIQASSSSVYGNTKKVPFLEKHSFLKPINPYGASKVAAETYCQIYSEMYGFSTIVFRIFSAYGPGIRPTAGIAKFISQIKETGSIDKVYKGVSRDYIYIDDILDAICLSLKKRLSFQIVNIASGRSFSTEEIINVLKKLMNVEFEVNYAPATNIEIGITRGSTHRAKKILGFSAKVGLEEGLNKLICPNI